MRSETKIKIVYIMEDCPAYDLYKYADRPAINWDTPDGNWVGIWGYDWGNQLGDYILKNDSRFIFEVRQPDTRADRIYEHRFESGAVHKLYPAKFNNKGKFIYSEELTRDLISVDNPDTIVHTGAFGRFTASFLDKLNVAAKVGSFHSEIILPIDNLFTLRKNVINYRRVFSDHLKFKRLVNTFDVLTYQTEYSLDRLMKYYSGSLERATMGTDFSRFVRLDKAGCRSELNLPQNAKIMISVGRINNIKSQAEVVRELTKLEVEHEFLYIVLGHGLKQDEELLMGASSALKEKSKILFPGYIRGDALVKYLNAADVFIMPSVSEAGPVASMEALACELPVITMNTGSVCDFLRANGCGMIIERGNFDEFGAGLKKFLGGCSIAVPDRKKSEAAFDWNSVARNFIRIYLKSIEKKL